jgi:hypothetical protein
MVSRQYQQLTYVGLTAGHVIPDEDTHMFIQIAWVVDQKFFRLWARVEAEQLWAVNYHRYICIVVEQERMVTLLQFPISER